MCYLSVRASYVPSVDGRTRTASNRAKVTLPAGIPRGFLTSDTCVTWTATWPPLRAFECPAAKAAAKRSVSRGKRNRPSGFRSEFLVPAALGCLVTFYT
jgi:hypothetical protein